MANNPHLSTAARNGMVDTLNTALGSGALFRLYSGTQPANANTALSGNTLLAEIALAASPFLSGSGGAAALDTTTPDSSADNSGTATWGSFVTSGGTRVLDVSVATASADMIIDNATIVAGQQVSLPSFTFSLPA